LKAGLEDLAWYAAALLTLQACIILAHEVDHEVDQAVGRALGPALSWLIRLIKQWGECSGLDWAAAVLLLAAAAQSVFQLCILLPIATCTDQCRGHLQDTVPLSKALWRAAGGISLPSTAHVSPEKDKRGDTW